jgi:hypothetical protein
MLAKRLDYRDVNEACRRMSQALEATHAAVEALGLG